MGEVEVPTTTKEQSERTILQAEKLLSNLSVDEPVYAALEEMIVRQRAEVDAMPLTEPQFNASQYATVALVLNREYGSNWYDNPDLNSVADTTISRIVDAFVVMFTKDNQSFDQALFIEDATD